MMRTLIILLLTAQAISVSATDNLPWWNTIETTNPEERNIIINAQQLYNNGYTYEAVAYLKKIVKTRKDFYDAHLWLGFLYKEIDNPNKAIENFSAAIRINPDSKIAHFLRGNCFVDLTFYRPALNDYIATIKLDPQFYGAYNNIAYIKLMNQGSSGSAHDRDVELAKGEITKILEQIEVNDKAVYFNMGIIHLRLGMHEKGIEYLEQSVSLDSSCSKCHYYLALGYFYEREYQNAKRNFSLSWQQGYNTQIVEDFIEYIAKVEDYMKANGLQKQSSH
jgi:tetratricopeptide (TPR) repeat protein